MNRRNFIGTLFGLVAAPNAIAKAISEYKPVAKTPLLKYTSPVLDWDVPVVYAPYMPLMVTELPPRNSRGMIKKLNKQ